MTEILGFVAAIMTTIAFVPQAWKTIRTKDTKSISLSMYMLLVIGIFLWIAYGVIIDAKPVIYANVVTGVLASTILIFKIKHTITKK